MSLDGLRSPDDLAAAPDDLATPPDDLASPPDDLNAAPVVTLTALQDVMTSTRC